MVRVKLYSASKGVNLLLHLLTARMRLEVYLELLPLHLSLYFLEKLLNVLLEPIPFYSQRIKLEFCLTNQVLLHLRQIFKLWSLLFSVKALYWQHFHRVQKIIIWYYFEVYRLLTHIVYQILPKKLNRIVPQKQSFILDFGLFDDFIWDFKIV
jgi:hypothetical protein